MDRTEAYGRSGERLDRSASMRCSSPSWSTSGHLTGFTGSNGELLLTGRRATLLTDGRYTEQASTTRRPDPDARAAPSYLPRRSCPAWWTAWGGWVRGARRHRGRRGKLAGRLGGGGGSSSPRPSVERERAWKTPRGWSLFGRAQAATDGAFDRVPLERCQRRNERATHRPGPGAVLLEKGPTTSRSTDSVVAFGENAAEPTTSRATGCEGDVVELVGARVQAPRRCPASTP